MSESLGERLKRLRERKKLTQAFVAESIRLSKGAISQYENNLYRPNNEILWDLAKLYEVSFAELLGIEVPTSVKPEDAEKWFESNYGQLGPLNTKKAQDVELKTSSSLFEMLSKVTDTTVNNYVPFFDIDITAGRFEVFDDVQEIPTGYIYAPEFSGCLACRVKGDSMYDRIYPGATAFVYRLQDKKYIDYNQIYLVVIAGYRVLKYIEPIDGDDTRVMLVSHNPRHKPWPVEKQDIQHLFLVKGYWNQTAN